MARAKQKSDQTKLHLREVVDRIQRRNCTIAEFSDWFSIEVDDQAWDREVGPEGQFEASINLDRIDVSGLESLARFGAAALAVDAIKAVRAGQGDTKRVPKASAKGAFISLVAEGDSWFNLPDIRFPFVIPPTLVDRFPSDWAVKNIAHWGDTLDQIIANREYLRHLTPDTRIFLFSAGGNDALGGGNLFSLLRQRTSGDLSPDNAPNYLRPEFHQLISDIERKISVFAKSVLKDFPNVHILMHGYDNAVPRQNGHWLGQHLQNRGFDPLWMPDFCNAIIKVMLKRFNTCLQNIDLKYPRFHHVDLTDTVKDQWWDELHPNKNGAQALSSKYQAEILKVARANDLAAHIV